MKKYINVIVSIIWNYGKIPKLINLKYSIPNIISRVALV